MKKLTCFKAYDIRGKLGEELNEDIAWRIGRAYGEFLKPKTIVLAPKRSISPRSISAWMAALKLPPAIIRWITTA